MLAGAVTAFATAITTGSSGLGVVTGALAGAALALIFAVLTMSLLANQVATGLALTIFGIGLSALIGSGFVGTPAERLPRLAISGLSDLPVIGPLLFRHDFLVYFSVFMTAAVAWFLTRTRAGMIVRAIGEAHEAAHSIGYPVIRIRYLTILFGGIMGGLGGAFLSLSYTPMWVEEMTAGRGCEVGIARRLDAELALVGWVQKVSNLMLNFNVVIRDTRPASRCSPAASTSAATRTRAGATASAICSRIACSRNRSATTRRARTRRFSGRGTWPRVRGGVRGAPEVYNRAQRQAHERPGGGDPTARAARHQQTLPRRRARQRRRRVRGDAGRDPCPARRERRRQEHAGQDHLRRAPGRCGLDPLERPRGHDRQPEGGAPPRHRHGVPAFLAVRGDDRAREHRARRGRRRRPARARCADRRGVRDLRPAARPAPPRAHALGRRAPAHRDRALPVAEPAAPDHGRADLGADPAGGGAAVRDPAPARRRRLLDPVHQPQARGDQGAVPARDHPAPGAGGRRMRSAAGDRAQHGRADDRQRARRRLPRARACRGRAASRGRRPEPGRRATVRHRPARASRSRSAAARSSASPDSPATARPSCSARSRASARWRGRRRSASTAARSGVWMRRRGAISASPACRRSATGTAPSPT